MRVNNTESFIKKAELVHENIYDYSQVEYKKSNEKVIIICKQHGQFQQIAANHLKGQGCPKCGSSKLSLTNEEFINRSILIHNNKYDYSLIEYKNNKDKIKIICSIHGEFTQTPNSHLNGNGCHKCYVDNLRMDVDIFITNSNKKHNNKYFYNKVNYINSNTKVIIICPNHGEFEQNPAEHLKGQGCPKCMLKNQTKLFEKLKENFINEKLLWEQSPIWLDKQRFDIYFPEYNIAIEYNGRQHYIPIKIFGGELEFMKTQERDLRKKDKCKENNCTLFEMKYDYNENDYEELVYNINTIIKLKENESKI